MIIVHDTFICKPGNASKVAKMFKEAMVDNIDVVNILTDMTGEYNRVIMVSKHDSLAAYEQSFQKYMQDTEEVKKMKGFEDTKITSQASLKGTDRVTQIKKLEDYVFMIKGN